MTLTTMNKDLAPKHGKSKYTNGVCISPKMADSNSANQNAIKTRARDNEDIHFIVVPSSFLQSYNHQAHSLSVLRTNMRRYPSSLLSLILG